MEAELLIFNGTRFERLTDIVADNGDAALPCDVDYAYRLKIIFKNTKAADVKLGITYEERK